MTRSHGCLDMSLRYFYSNRTRFPYSARHQKAWRFLLTILARLTRLYPAKILSQIEDDTGVVPIEILAQVKGKEAPNDALPASLNKFKFERILSEDPITHSVALLGSFPWIPISAIEPNTSTPAGVRVIIRVEKTALSPESVEKLFWESDVDGEVGKGGLVRRVEIVESTDIASPSPIISLTPRSILDSIHSSLDGWERRGSGM